MIILQKKYGKLEVDDTEPDHVQIWCNEGIDPQVVHVERDNLQKLIIALINSIDDGKLLVWQHYIKANCHKTQKELAHDLGIGFDEFRKLCKASGIRLKDLRNTELILKDSRKPPILVNK